MYIEYNNCYLILLWNIIAWFLYDAGDNSNNFMKNLIIIVDL